MNMDRLRTATGRLRSLLLGRGGQIAYYAAVALALTAIAAAAEHYRDGRGEEAQTPALPAVEFSQSPQEAEAAEPCAPQGATCLRGYSDCPEWSNALGLWEDHRAVDYRLNDGTVECLCPGVVRTVGVSGACGGFVEVVSGELLLRYASISPREGLAPGDKLRMGEALGRADANMPGEASLGAHLHLEASIDGESADFAALTAGD